MEKRNVSPLSTRAALSSVNQEARTVDVVWSTGAAVLRSSFWDGSFFEELSMDPKHIRMGRLQNKAPFLANHDGGDVARILGVIESARLEGNKGVATVRFAKAEDDPEADKVFRKIADGIVKHVSVGYRTYALEKIEGGDAKIPTFRATDWEPFEISAVAMGADDSAVFRSADSNVATNECTLSRNTEKNKMDEAELKRQAELKAESDKALKAATESATKMERERSSGIASAVRAAKLDQAFGDKLVVDGVSLDAARALVIDEMAKRSESIKTTQHQTVTVTDDENDKFARGAMAQLISRSADARQLVEKAVAMKARGFEKAIELDPGEFRGMSLMELGEESLRRRGQKFRNHDKMQRASQIFTARSEAGAFAGTADFPVLLENALYKMLLAAYVTQPDTWSLFCKTDTVSDFRVSPRYRTGSLSVLDAKNEAGEFKNKAIPDGQKYGISTATKGNIIAVTRELLINDDMGALSDLAVKFGRAAKLSIESDVYALLTANGGLGANMSGPGGDGNALFFNRTGNNNIGTGGALSVQSLDADAAQMAGWLDISGNEILDLKPKVLVVPRSLKGQADNLNASQYDVTQTNKFQVPNIVRGLFQTIVATPRLTGTRRYMFTDTGDSAAIVVAFLEGQGEGPVIESKEGWRVDGTEMRVRVDYKAQVFDSRGAMTNAGV